jgi:hypothetical protein
VRIQGSGVGQELVNPDAGLAQMVAQQPEQRQDPEQVG